MRIGGSIAVALIVFGAGILGVPPRAYAQQDAAPPIYNTPNSDHSAKPLFLRKLFGTDEPNSGIGAPKPYDFSHRNDTQAAPQGINEEVQTAFFHNLEVHVSGVRAMFDQRHKEQLAEAEQDRQRSYAFLNSLRANAMTAAQSAHPQVAAHTGNFVHPHAKRERQARSSGTHTHNHPLSGEAPAIYVQH